MNPSLLHRYNPAVPRHWLLGCAGMMWTSVGILLCTRAVNWLLDGSPATAIVILSASVAIAVPADRFGFSKVVRKNIVRISELPERACVFALTSWKGYFLIALMITLGTTLRNSSLPKEILSLPYATMGCVLLMGSFRLYRQFLRTTFPVRSSTGVGTDRR